MTPQADTTRTAPDTHEPLLTLLKKYWGYPDFRPRQEAIIRSVVSGRDTLAILTTGSGKVALLPAALRYTSVALRLSSPLSWRS